MTYNAFKGIKLILILVVLVMLVSWEIIDLVVDVLPNEIQQVRRDRIKTSHH